MRSIEGDRGQPPDDQAGTQAALPAWLAGQKEAFRSAINGAPLQESLKALVRTAVGQYAGGSRCAFYVVNSDGSALQHIAGMPEPGTSCADHLGIGFDSPACGLAVHTRNPVITSDVLREPRWEPWLWLAKRHNCRAVWSFPVEASAGKVIGTLAMYFNEPREPTGRDHELAAALTQAAAIIISRHHEAERRARAELLLSEGEQRLQRSLDAEKRAVERGAVPAGELQRRVRNIFASIRSIVGRTVGSGDGIEEFRAHVEGRLAAMARTQGALAELPGAGVDLQMLVREELLAQAALEDQFSIKGPDVRLAGKAAEIIALAIHELATNATKFGALAHQRGGIRVAWSVAGRADKDWLTFDWDESGTRLPSPAQTHHGFGTELITRRIASELNGIGELALASNGVRARIAFPLCSGDGIPDKGSARDSRQLDDAY